MDIAAQDQLVQHLDVHYCDLEGGWLSHPGDLSKDAKDSFVAVYYFHTLTTERSRVMKRLCLFADIIKKAAPGNGPALQSCIILKDCMEADVIILYLRSVTTQVNLAVRNDC